MHESIEIALQHNLDVQIERINPLIARHNLSIAYADWQPAFSASGSHNFSSNPAGFDSSGRPIPNTESSADAFPGSPGGAQVGIGGVAPSGLNYNLSGTASDTVFRRPNTNGILQSTETSRAGVSLTMKQPLLKNGWIDGTRQNILIDKNRIKFSELGVRQQIMNVVNNTAQAYYELIFAQENIKVQRAALQLAERLVSENRKRVQVGTLAPLDEKQAESQAAASKADLLAAQITFENQENVLKGLMTDNYTELHATELTPTDVLAAPIPVLNLQESWSKGMTQRPDLLQARLDVQRLNVILRYTRNQLFPELDLIGSYGFAGAGTEFSSAFGVI